MIGISFFGSGTFIAILTYFIYIFYPNRIKAISFITYMIFVIYIISNLKNAYH